MHGVVWVGGAGFTFANLANLLIICTTVSHGNQNTPSYLHTTRLMHTIVDK